MSNIVIRRISTWCAFMYYVVTNYRILLLYKVFLSFISSSATDTGEVGSGIKGRLLLKPRAQTILKRTHLPLMNKTHVCKKRFAKWFWPQTFSISFQMIQKPIILIFERHIVKWNWYMSKHNPDSNIMLNLLNFSRIISKMTFNLYLMFKL